MYEIITPNYPQFTFSPAIVYSQPISAIPVATGLCAVKSFIQKFIIYFKVKIKECGLRRFVEHNKRKTTVPSKIFLFVVLNTFHARSMPGMAPKHCTENSYFRRECFGSRKHRHVCVRISHAIRRIAFNLSLWPCG